MDGGTEGGDRWSRLLEDVEAHASELEAEGWETITIAAGDAAAVVPESGRTDSHGFSYVVPGDAAEAFEAAFEPGRFPRTEVYRTTTPQHLYLLTVAMDPSTSTAVLLAGVLDRDSLLGCERAALDAGRMYTHVFTVDGTHLGTFEHDDPGPFFPDGG